MFYLILIVFFIWVLYLNTVKESFRYEINNKLCLDNYTTCLNYDMCCSRKHFHKLGHAKQCIHVEKNKNCDIYRKKIYKKKKIPFIKPRYIPGYSFIPFNNWNNHRHPVCHGKNIAVPQGSIRNRRVYNSQSVDNSVKHAKLHNDHHEEHVHDFFTKLDNIVHNKLSKFLF